MIEVLPQFAAIAAASLSLGWIARYTYERAAFRVTHSECQYSCLTLLNHNAVLRRQLAEGQQLNELMRNREMELQGRIFAYEQAQAVFPQYEEFAEVEEREECAA